MAILLSLILKKPAEEEEGEDETLEMGEDEEFLHSANGKQLVLILLCRLAEYIAVIISNLLKMFHKSSKQQKSENNFKN